MGPESYKMKNSDWMTSAVRHFRVPTLQAYNHTKKGQNLQQM